MQCNLSSIYWLTLYGRECVGSTDMKTNKMKPCQPGVYSSHTHLAPCPPIATISPFFSLLFSHIYHYYPPSPFLFPPSSKGCCKWYWTKYGKQTGAGPYLFLTQATACHKAWTSGFPVRPISLQAIAVASVTNVDTKHVFQHSRAFALQTHSLFMLAHG